MIQHGNAGERCPYCGADLCANEYEGKIEYCCVHDGLIEVLQKNFKRKG